MHPNNTGRQIPFSITTLNSITPSHFCNPGAMKSLVALVFICMFLPKAELLRCYSCDPTKCDQIEPQTCSAGMDSCITATATVLNEKLNLKACAPKEVCDVGPSSFMGVTIDNVKCCQTDLCNGAERFTLSLFLMFIPLLSFILFT
ncbi:urokinase plasminogen activator surface receptor-like [Clarias magur]|uniref:Urokinase plasminogen activator surface receptor-like n=1 Tax=Clarias magur TaxID=1594786 RepID=A0A8J4TVL5_CLAMG|nr:urokinase plasminogen activator surface receptor-like [Clarias magur]